MIVKRDGRRETFDPGKVRRALRTACRKRPVSADVIERMVERVGASLMVSGNREAASSAIGEALLRELKVVDEVSYARFASVFLRFEHLDDFAGLAGPDPEGT
jgi:transcriptional repressor NrdR